jgi:hypothetical protein
MLNHVSPLKIFRDRTSWYSSCAVGPGAAFRVLALALPLVFLFACDTVGPRSPDGEILVRSGSSQADTAYSLLPEPLGIEVRTGSEAGAGLEVHFISPPSNGGPRAAFLRDDSVHVHVVDTTDASGSASVQVRLGARAGEAVVRVDVPTLGVSREIPFEILPGQPAVVVDFGPSGIVTLGGETLFSARFRDTYGNDVDEPVICASEDRPLAVTPACSAEGVEFGLAALRLLYGEREVAQVPIRVLPRNEIVFTDSHGTLRRATTDSSFLGAIPGDGLDAYSWSPGGDTLVGTRDGRIFYSVFGDGGPSAPSEAFPERADAVRDPRFSPDGQWVYYAEVETGELWRIRVDGTAAEPLASTGGAVLGRGPSPSPDGSRLVFRAHPLEGDEDAPLRILDLQTGAVTELGVEGTHPTWSPSGEWIAYRAWSGSELWQLRLIAPDASQGPVLDVPFAVSRPDWSLGSTYLAYTTGHHWHEHIVVEVASGVYVKGPAFPGTSGGTFQRLGVPVWRP